MNILNILKPRWVRDFARHIRNFNYECSDDGLLIAGARIQGRLMTAADDGLGERIEDNLLTIEGMNHILGVVLSNTTRVTTWYVAPASANVTYSASWTAANFAANATEITTDYSEATRVEFVEGAASAGAISNIASPATITSASSSPVTIWGVGILSASAKGATTGVLLAASKFATTARTLAITPDTLGLKWQLALS